MILLGIIMGCSTPEPIEEEKQIVEEITQFRVLLMADPHLSGGEEHKERLHRAVLWANEQKEDLGIALVIVLGDIGWGAGLVESKEELDLLEVPYIPIIGDNEIHAGDEQRFLDVFSPVFDTHRLFFDDWNDSFVPVWNEEHQKESLFHNVSFSYRGVRFLGLDWASRSSGSILGEMGDIHDFSGGSFSWLTQELTHLEESTEPIFLCSHIPMYINAGAFDIAEMEKIETLFWSYDDRLLANFAGHYHNDVENSQALYDLYILDAIWDDDIRMRLLEISMQGEDVWFETEIISLD